MANEQTSVPLFVADTILTAAQQNISAGTGVPVFATTVTRDAAFGGASEKVLAEGQLCYLSASNIVQYYDGAAWATVGPAASGLTLISATTIGTTVSSVTVSSAFSATYDNYSILISGGVASTGCDLKMTLGATTTGYNSQLNYGAYTNSVAGVGSTNGSSFIYAGTGSTNHLCMNTSLQNPFLTTRTLQGGLVINSTIGGSSFGYLDNATSYTAFTITPSSGTITGGTIRVYGYQNS